MSDMNKGFIIGIRLYIIRGFNGNVCVRILEFGVGFDVVIG